MCEDTTLQVFNYL